MSRKDKEKKEEVFEPVTELDAELAYAPEEEEEVEYAEVDEVEEDEAEEEVQPALFKYKNAVYRSMNCSQPVITPINPIQLTPIIVPVAVVPYVTQNQPVLQYADSPEPVYQAPAPSAPTQVAPAAAPAPVAPAPYAPPAPAYQPEPVYIQAPPVVEEKTILIKEESPFGKNLMMLICSIVFLLPIILGLFEVSFGGVQFGSVDVIGRYRDIFAAEDVMAVMFAKENIGVLLLALAVVTDLALLIMSLVCLIAKRPANYMIPAMLIAALVIAGLICNLVVDREFASKIVTENLGWLLLAILAVVIGAISVVLARDNTRKKELKDEEELLQYSDVREEK